MKALLTLLAIFSFIVNANAQTKSVLLLNGTAHLGNGEVINNSAIAFKEGKITLVANALTIKLDMTKFDTVINVEGKHIYPGIIGTNSTLGLVEIESTRSTIDDAETGNYNPNVRAQIAYNTDSKIIPTVRANGILLVQATPRSGVISGTSSVMATSGWNWEDATIKANDGIHLNWPVFAPRKSRRNKDAETPSLNEYLNQVTGIKNYLLEAKAYSNQKKYDAVDVRFESLRGLFNGTQTLYLHTNLVKEITDAIVMCKDLGIAKKAIVGGYESYMVAGLMKENNVSVMLRRIHELPLRDDEDIDLPFKIPALLQQAGILYCIQTEGDQEATNMRNLPFQAATCVSFGITKEEALKAITLNAAKILGIDKMYGSLEPEKSATLFISDGDALDAKTNNVTHAWMNGKRVSLNTHQKDLYKKYSDKYNNK
jgi:imidazolonepropionase-like amidohydrolase